MFELAVTRLKLWALELEYFLIDTDNDPLVRKLRKERSQHQRRIIELRGMHDPSYDDWVARSLDDLYSHIGRIDDILDHKYRYRCPETGYDVQFEWWMRTS
jgi:hypothetical protein